MRKITIIAFLSVCCTFASYGTAMAQEIIGTWLGQGGTSMERYAYSMRFFPNGGLQSESAQVGSGGSSVQDCQGSYQYDGRILISRLSSCNGGPVPVATGGPIIFDGPNVFTWGDLTYRRQ
jgi:hypothetical protein